MRRKSVFLSSNFFRFSTTRFTGRHLDLLFVIGERTRAQPRGQSFHDETERLPTYVLLSHAIVTCARKIIASDEEEDESKHSATLAQL